MTLLLGNDAVVLYPAKGEDSHGWALPSAEPVWTGLGNLQLQPGRSEPRASEAGGHGPFAPAASLTGTLFLPIDAPVADGMLAEISGVTFALSAARRLEDPRELNGPLACWAATADQMARPEPEPEPEPEPADA